MLGEAAWTNHCCLPAASLAVAAAASLDGSIRSVRISRSVMCMFRFLWFTVMASPTPACAQRRQSEDGVATRHLLQCFHQINYPYRRPLPWFLDPLTALFPLDQFAKHLLVAILEFFRLEVASFRGDDVCGKVQHLFREFHVRQVTEIIRLLADLVGIMELMPKRPLARGSIAMTCSQVVSTTLPSATMSAFLIASRITA
jgi:hypothetical protein